MNRFAATIGLLFVAAPLCFAASEPLDQWAWRNPLPSGAVSDLMAVTYANATFAAVGGGAALVSSNDGTNWVSRTLGPLYGVGTNYYVAGLAWGGRTWVAVGLGNDPAGAGNFPVLPSSPDLIAWTPQAIPGGGVNTLRGVVYGSGLFVVVGGGNDPDPPYQGFGAILTSPDGVQWTLQDSGTTDAYFDEVIYGSGLFVAGSTFGNVLTSPDGVNWTFVPNPHGQLNGLRGLAYGAGLYLASSVYGIWASTDAVNWTNRVSSTQAEDITCGDGLFVAVSSNGQIQTSTNGLRWTLSGSMGAGTYEALGYGNGEFVAVGLGALEVSNNGYQWTNLASAVTTVGLGEVAYGQGTFVAAGGVILYSTNGIRWCVSAPAQSGALFLESVAFGGGSFVAVNSQGTILVSVNGIDWLTVTNIGDGLLTDVIYGNGQFVGVGVGGLVLTSTNGTVWVVQDSGSSLDMVGLAYGEGLFVAGVGQGVLTSPDGVQWTEQDFNVPGASVGALGYGNGLFVAVGRTGLILTSTNAVDWAAMNSGTPADLYSVSYGAGTFLVTGRAGTLLTSTNGTDWVSRDAGTMLALGGATFGQSTFVVVGDGGAILQSGVLPPFGPRLSPTPGWTNGAFGLTLSAPLGGRWDLQASTNLLDWTTLGTVTVTNSKMLFMDTGAAGLSQRLYRAVSR